MDLQLVVDNLRSAPVLAFMLGVVATLAKAELRLPDAAYGLLSTYLLLAIGLRGGVELSEAGLAVIWRPALLTIALGLVTPLVAYVLFRRLAGADGVNASALAAHYGSVSVVTFTAAKTFLASSDVATEGYLATLVALLEVPGIVVGLLLAGGRRRSAGEPSAWSETLREVVTGRSIVLLAGGVAVGLIAGEHGTEKVRPLFDDLFTGVLMLFLLEMGVVAGLRLRVLRDAGWRVVVVATVVPVVNGMLGALAGSAAGLGVGGTTVLATMAASASYIAAPAAVRIALPAADPGLYVTTSLGVTFPFNLVVGIPLYYVFAQVVT